MPLRDQSQDACRVLGGEVRRKRYAGQRGSGRAASSGLARRDDLGVCPSKTGTDRGSGRPAINLAALRNGDARARRTRGLAT